MSDQLSFEERIKRYSLRELEQVADGINQERFPERYNLVLDEIEARRSGRKTIISWEDDGRASTLRDAQAVGVVEYDEGEAEDILERQYTTVLRRIVASIIDAIILAIASGILSSLVIPIFLSSTRPGNSQWLSYIITIVLALIPVAYRFIMHTASGQTIGKHVMKVRLIDVEDRGPITRRQGVLRELLAIGALVYSIIVSVQFVGLTPGEQLAALGALLKSGAAVVASTLPVAGFAACGLVNTLMLFFHPQHRTLDDLIAGTVVVREEAWELQNRDYTR